MEMATMVEDVAISEEMGKWTKRGELFYGLPPKKVDRGLWANSNFKLKKW